MAEKTKRNRYIMAQLKVDKEFCPSKELFESNPEKYYKAWETYLTKTAECVAAYKKDLNTYNDYKEQDADPARRKTDISYAMTQVSSTSSYLVKQVAKPSFYPHFHLEFEKLKAQFNNYADEFPLFDDAQAGEFNDRVDILAKTPGIAKTLLDALRALPFAHPARLFLPLPRELYRERTRRYNEKRNASSTNTPIAQLSQVKNFVEKVYVERNKNPKDYANPYLAVAFATGRRSIEIGLLTKFSPSARPGHIHVSNLAKESDLQSLDIPVLFLSPEQVLELVRIARNRLEKVVYGRRTKELERIKRERDTRAFNDDIPKVSETFNATFEFFRLLPTDLLNDKATAHKATRGIYADVASKAVATMEGYLGKSNLEVRRMILGHTSQETTRSYLDIQVIDDVNPNAPISMVIMDTAAEQTPDASSDPDPAKPEPRKGAKKENAKTTAPAKPTPKTPEKPQAEAAPVNREKEITPPFSASAHRKFITEAVNPKMTLAALEFSKKKRLNGIVTIQLKLNTFKHHPSLNDLAAIADEPSALAYVKLLDQQGIKHQIS